MSLGVPARLNAETLIELVERATHLSAGQWSLALLQAAFPLADQDEFLDLPVGARDRLIMSIRAQMLAAPLRSEPECGECGARFELTAMPEDLGFGNEGPQSDAGVRSVSIDGKQIKLRAVRLSDLLAVEAIADVPHAAQLLAERACEGDAQDLSLAALEAALEEMDPGADVWLATQCPECGAEHNLAFDPVHYTATELRHLTRRILQDVVDIARVFHWSERDILALPESRRAYYVAEALG